MWLLRDQAAELRDRSRHTVPRHIPVWRSHDLKCRPKAVVRPNPCTTSLAVGSDCRHDPFARLPGRRSCHFDQRAIERATVILRVAERYSSDELDAALKAARRAIGYCVKEASAGANAGRALIEMIDAARSIARNRA